MEEQYKEEEIKLKGSGEKPEQVSQEDTLISQLQEDLPSHLEIISFIGKGGMGSVYKVKDKNSNSIYALKVLRPELAEDQAAAKRFEQEAKNIKQFEHPDIISTYSTGKTEKQRQYILMEFFEGTNLQRYLKSNGVLEEKEAIDLFIKLCGAIDYAHKNNVIHRDLKPGNILVKNEKNTLIPKVVDFGIAKLFGSNSQETMTNTGEVFGSPSYMSPEQCLGKDLDARSDVYSMGCLMYHCVTGEPPFASETPILTAFQHIKADAPKFELKSNISSNLKTVILGALKKNPKYRYQSMQSLIDDLQKVKNGKKPSKKLKKKNSLHAGYFVVSACLLAGLLSYSLTIKPTPDKQRFPIHSTPSIKYKKKDYKIDMKTASLEEALNLVALAGKETGWDTEASSGTSHGQRAYEGSSLSSKVSNGLAKRGKSIIPDLIKNLYNRSDLVRTTCSDALIEIGPESISPVIDKVAKEQKINKHAMAILQSQPQLSFEKLLSLVSKSKSRKQFFLTRVLAYVTFTRKGAIELDSKQQTKIETVFRKASHDNSRYLAGLILTSQEKIPPSTIATLTHCLNSDKSPKVRALAASSLGAIMYKTDSEAYQSSIAGTLFYAFAKDTDPSVRYSIAVNLAANANNRNVDLTRLNALPKETDTETKLAIKTAIAANYRSSIEANESARLVLLKPAAKLTITDIETLMSYIKGKLSKNKLWAMGLAGARMPMKKPGLVLPLALSCLDHAGYELNSKDRLSVEISTIIVRAEQNSYPADGWVVRYSTQNADETITGRDLLRKTELKELVE